MPRRDEMTSVGPLIKASALSVIKMVLIMAVGVLAASYPRGAPVLGKEFLQGLSRFAVLIVWPAVAIWSVGSTDIGSGTELGLLCAWCTFHTAVALLLGSLFSRLLPLQA